MKIIIDKQSPPYPYRLKELINYIKVLENNILFEKEIKKLRKQLNIPVEGYSQKEAEKFYNESDEEFFDKITESTNQLICKHPQFKHVPSIDSIVLSNTAYLDPLQSPIWLWETEYAGEKIATINISSKNVSKQDLHNFIDEWWEQIKIELDILPDVPVPYVSKRDVRILQMRDKEGLSFKKIADAIVAEFGIDDEEASINEDSIKTAYWRAKKRTNSLK